MLYSPGLRYAAGFLLLMLMLLFPLVSPPLSASASEQCFIGNRYLVGHLETVTRIDHQFDTQLPALIDSGSTTSSMDARDITFKTLGTNSHWVRFKILTERGGKGREVTLLKPVKRYIRVQTHSGKPQRRPVIEATIELGNIKTTTEFSLT
ncbi:RimK/LysX family protein, partial [Endozoicomonas sp. YOMI1]|uniref:putative ATP-dependent zinc protease n=1 Tax=Endozoicomonas sp. YOMI1 TaxID=2828739 RepID=UPI002148BB76